MLTKAFRPTEKIGTAQRAMERKIINIRQRVLASCTRQKEKKGSELYSAKIENVHTSKRNRVYIRFTSLHGSP